MIWVGQFDSEADFEKYMNQSAFRQWWKEYDEDNEELRCQFCKELGVTSYDEDFLIMKYCSQGLNGLLNLIPTETKKLAEAIAAKGIFQANAVICYNVMEGISPKRAEKATRVTFLGSFLFKPDTDGTNASTAGLHYMTWIGLTNKSKEEFMEYFNQEEYLKELIDYENGKTKKRPDPELRCQFCKDLNIKYYHPEFLKITFSEGNESPFEMLKRIIQDENIPDRWLIYDLDNYNITHANCAFCYIPNGFRDKKKDQKIFRDSRLIPSL